MTDRSIAKYMTTMTETVAIDCTLREADEMMQQLKIRHLPVLDEGELVGIVSLGDLHVVESLDKIDPDEVTVGRAMTPLPYTVPPEESLEEVARVMAENRYGCAIVVDDGSLVGIFTVTDAVRVLSEVLGDQRAHQA